MNRKWFWRQNHSSNRGLITLMACSRIPLSSSNWCPLYALITDFSVVISRGDSDTFSRRVCMFNRMSTRLVSADDSLDIWNYLQGGFAWAEKQTPEDARSLVLERYSVLITKYFISIHRRKHLRSSSFSDFPRYFTFQLPFAAINLSSLPFLTPRLPFRSFHSLINSHHTELQLILLTYNLRISPSSETTVYLHFRPLSSFPSFPARH